MTIFFIILISLVMVGSICITYVEIMRFCERKRSESNSFDIQENNVVPPSSSTECKANRKWLELVKEDENREIAKLEKIKREHQIAKEDYEREVMKNNQERRLVIEFVSSSISQHIEGCIIDWFYTPISNGLYAEFQNECLELRSDIQSDSLVNENTSIVYKLQNVCGSHSYGSILIEKQGVVTLGGCVVDGKRIVKPNTLLFSVDTSAAAITKYKERIENDAHQRKNANDDRLNNFAQRREEREKERIRQRFLKQKRQRELERKVQQEMMDKGKLVLDGTKRRHIPHSVVSEVYRRDGAKCVLCGSKENLQLDHIIPFSKGGSDTAENLQVLCQKCNLAKSNKI